jgi:hypothetical protein
MEVLALCSFINALMCGGLGFKLENWDFLFLGIIVLHLLSEIFRDFCKDLLESVVNSVNSLPFVTSIIL